MQVMDLFDDVKQEIKAKKNGFTHDNVDNKSVDWYTPKWIFDALNLEFDLDPAHPKEKLDWIPAKKYFHKEQDGLKREWQGRVWLNPPYGTETGKWLERMNQHRNGIALIFARTDTVAFHDYCANADALLFLKGRIKFIDGLGITSNNGAGAGSMLVAWGIDNVAALEGMKDKGFLVRM